jgi:hypothetical protein
MKAVMTVGDRVVVTVDLLSAGNPGAVEGSADTEPK